MVVAWPLRCRSPFSLLSISRRFIVADSDKVQAQSLLPSLRLEPFVKRHVGPNEAETERMLAELGMNSKEEFMQAALPKGLESSDIVLTNPVSEYELASLFRKYGKYNSVFRSFIGQGYNEAITPAVIQRNILENPAWYTPYTPYQPEISQGRLEALFTFQTLVCELTSLPLANASLLDEATAAAEAMSMLYASSGRKKKTFLASSRVFSHTLSCLKLRSEGLGIDLKIIDEDLEPAGMHDVFGVLVQYPDKFGSVTMKSKLIEAASQKAIPIACATDPMALILLKTQGQLNFDVAVGSMQRFGLPIGYGGPHAAFFACKGKYQRLMPGRVVGLSKDARGNPAYRLALQTREQHIRRDRATSNICTSQALLAVMSSMYAVYHGPEGLRSIASRINTAAIILADMAERLGHRVKNKCFFDTVIIELDEPKADYYHKLAKDYKVNLLEINPFSLGIALNETTASEDIEILIKILSGIAIDASSEPVLAALTNIEPRSKAFGISPEMTRNDPILHQSVFNLHHSEAELTRYIHRLAHKDFSLVTSMIPLGSCTMKLNGTSELAALSMPEFMNIHPLAPADQTVGYAKILSELKEQLSQLTGFPHICLQPNSGAQGEYLALSMIRKALKEEGKSGRNICIVPVSAHGTNPASAAMAGFKITSIECTRNGRIDMDQLKSAIATNHEKLAVLMITYPSTFGIFDDSILEACKLVKKAGGYIYLDGANMNALTGYIRPTNLGVDACHLNLHKTFCIPHGGGGPGSGPIGVSERLAPYLPSGSLGVENVSGAQFGSASIHTVSWAFINLMGLSGLKGCTFKALLNANYMMKRLSPFYHIRYKGEKDGLCAHEFVVDLRTFEATAGVLAIDVAKRLQDYGFHAPTMSWPVPGTLMIEPTESENLAEIDSFIEAMISIRSEIADIENGKADRNMNLLKMAPHTQDDVCNTEWSRPYNREQAALPMNRLKKAKIWPSVNRLDDLYGDQNFVCSLQN